MTVEHPTGRRRRPWGRGDIQPTGRPDVSAEQWRDQAAALDRLRDWAERYAVETITWYLRDKRGKRTGSRLLRAAAVVLAVAGGLVPLISSGDGPGGLDPNTGYVLLALAAGCVAFDHFFGLSATWMRDIATAQALRGRLARFQLAWAAWEAIEAGLLKPDPASDEPAGGVRAAFDLIEGLVADVTQAAEGETAQWITDLRSAMGALRRQAGAGLTPPPDPGAQGDEPGGRQTG